ncbi:TonB-dependent receptor plug domain-containing protein, partial [Gemmatimonadota bacterium]
FAGLMVADVERIEVARGPASALYGSDAMVGVINIITRRGRGAPQASLAARAGSYGRTEWTADLHGGGETTSYSLSASRLSTDGILEFNNRFETSTLSGAVFLRPDERTRIGFIGRYGDRTYHFPTDGAGNVVDANAFTYGDYVALSVEALRILADGVEMGAVVRRYSWDGGSDDQPDGPQDNAGFFGYSSLDALQRTSVDLKTNLELPGGSIFTLGVEVEEVEQRSFSESLSEYGPSNSQSRNQRSNKGYYVHVTTQAGGLSGNLGARIEDNEQYGEFFTYQAGLSYSVNGTGTRFRGSLGEGMKEPSFLETTNSAFSVGDPNLDPERSRVWEVGVEQSLDRIGGTVAVTWFHQSLRDLIQYTFSPPEAGAPNYYNVAEARSRGLEVTADLPLGPIALSGGYTYLDTEVLDAGFDQGDGATFVEGEALIRRPGHQVNLGGAYSFARGSATADVRLVGARFDRDFSAWPSAPVELGRYTLVSLGGEILLLEPRGKTPGLTLLFRGENLLDLDYQEVFGYAMPGRALLVGGRLGFGG